MSIRNISFSMLLALLLAACGSGVPTEYNKSQQLPAIYPDYCGVTVPQNIAPLNFLCDGDAAKPMVARFTTSNQQIVCSGNKIEIDADDWRTLVADAIGKAIKVEVFIKTDGQWTLYKPFNIYVSADSIDPYISYRLISPSYVSYEELTISQRCLENFSESVIYDNMLCSTELSGQCINCHSYQQYNPQRMQFHARQNLGGTVVAYDGKLRKINMKHDSLLSAGVYPAWHPTLPLIVYSTNSTHQTFHTTDPNKIEVFDSASDLIAYDVEHNRVVNIENDSTEFEVFPAWSPAPSCTTAAPTSSSPTLSRIRASRSSPVHTPSSITSTASASTRRPVSSHPASLFSMPQPWTRVPHCRASRPTVGSLCSPLPSMACSTSGIAMPTSGCSTSAACMQHPPRHSTRPTLRAITLGAAMAAG